VKKTGWAKPTADREEIDEAATVDVRTRLRCRGLFFSSIGGAFAGQVSVPPGRVIVPLSPGGAIDVFARALGKEFEARTGASVVVENKAGANTIIAANACKSAAPDGYTFCLLTRSTVSINPEIYPEALLRSADGFRSGHQRLLRPSRS